MTLPPRRRPLRVPGFDYSDPGHIYLVTIRAKRGASPFLNPGLSAAVVRSLNHLRDARDVRLYCYCLMPDHLHALLSVSEWSGSLIKVIRAFKSYTTREAWACGWSGALWERSFHERAIRGDEECRTTCEYILGNPVHAGLAQEPGQYPYAALVDPLPL